jgi:hypothetical protein
MCWLRAYIKLLNAPNEYNLQSAAKKSMATV